MKRLSLLILLFYSSVFYSQEYELYNDILNSLKSDTIYVDIKFTKIDQYYLSNHFYKDNWSLIHTDESEQKLKEFLQNFQFDGKSYYPSEEMGILDVRKIDKIVANENSDVGKSNYLTLSRPIFNKGKTWAVVHLASIFREDVGSSGEMVIYKLKNGKWCRFYSVTTWIN